MGWRLCLAVKAWLCVGAASAVLAAPRIVCDEPVYVFGDATTQPAIAHEFVLRNGGDADLRFGKVKTCCGVEAALAAGRLAPGSNAVLAVKLSLAGRRGPVNKSIYVASNDPRQPYYRLALVGTVAPGFYWTPSKVAFADFATNGGASQRVTIVTGDTACLITNIVSSTPCFAARLVTNAAPALVVEIAVNPPLPKGITKGTVTVDCEGAGSPRAVIPVTATVFADLIVVPSELRFSDRAKSGPVDRYLAVRSRSGVPFDIVGVEWDGNEPLWDKASFLDGWRIHLTDIEADACKGPLVILTNHPDESRLAIPVRTVPVTLEQKGLH